MNARELAYDALIKSDVSSSFSNIEINTALLRYSFSKEDSALFTALYMGVIEKKITLDYIISKYSKIKVENLDINIKTSLRMGIYQILFMDKIPEYSAVNESVKLVPEKAKGFVNAVLRSFLRNGKAVDYPKDRKKYISVTYSVSEDIIDILGESFGSDSVETLLKDLSFRQGISLRINRLKTSKEEIESYLNERNIKYESNKLSDNILIVFASVSDISELLSKGYVFVQDPSSCTFVDILSPKKGDRILDACACPGGKSFSCAIHMDNTGEVISCDLHKNKMSLIENGAKKLGIDIIKTMEQNAKEYRKEFESYFDIVICDVPCSGIGVISKKPEIRYKTRREIDPLPSTQIEILNNCSKYVKPGGLLSYSTCTLNKHENEEIVNNFLSTNKDFIMEDFSCADIQSNKGMYVFMPNISGNDGFFMAKLRRVK